MFVLMRVVRVFSKTSNLPARFSSASESILFFAEESNFGFFLLLMGDAEGLRLGVEKTLEASLVKSLSLSLNICEQNASIEYSESSLFT